MTRFARHILTGAAAGFLCFCGALAAEAQDVFLRPAMEAFVDKDTLLVFPAQIDTFQKVRVRKNENPVFGTVVRYENETGSCADVYIYSLDTGAKPVPRTMLQKHFEETDLDIMKMPESNLNPMQESSRIRTVEHIKAAGRKAPEGGFEAYYRIRNGATLMDSVLFLSVYSGKLIKVRVSYSPEDEDENVHAYAFIDAIAEMLNSRTSESASTGPQTKKTESTAGTPETEAQKKQTPAAEPKTGA